MTMSEGLDSLFELSSLIHDPNTPPEKVVDLQAQFRQQLHTTAMATHQPTSGSRVMNERRPRRGPSAQRFSTVLCVKQI